MGLPRLRRYWLAFLVDNENGRHDMKCLECARRKSLEAFLKALQESEE